MRKKQPILFLILFVIMMTLLFLPLLQQHLNFVKMKPLNGVFEPTEKPELTLKNYTSGQWQARVEPYISENFGFREFVIRLYNQYVFDFYSKTYSGEVAVGKDGWLYQKDGINQYFGLMNSRYHRTNEQFKENLDLEMRSLTKIRAILKEYGVELMTFTLPVKSYLYPEHLRPHHYEDTLFDAGDYVDRQMTAMDFPHIDMTPWFQKIQKDYPFTLFFEKGSHWASGAVIATDSMLHYMESLKGVHFPDIVMEEPQRMEKGEGNPQDQDLADLLNTLWLPRQRLPRYEIPVSIAIDSNTVYPNVLFIGSSYYWHMTYRVPFSKVFSNRDFMYYNLYYISDEEQRWQKMEEVNTLTELLTHDYVVYFRNEPQLYSDGFYFGGKSLIALCISEERLKEKTKEVADSLAVAWHDEHPDWNANVFLKQAKIELLKNPELFEELRGEEVPTVRNPQIENVLVQREILSDREWRFLLNAKAKNDSIDFKTACALEANNVLNNKALLRNRAFFTTYDYFDFLVDESYKAISRQPEASTDRLTLIQQALADVEARVQRHEFDTDSLMMASCVMNAIVKNFEKAEAMAAMQKKAAEKGRSIDKMFRDDAVWCFNNINDPERYVNENTVGNAFELYKIDRKIRKDPSTMAVINQRRQENNLPLRAALDREIQYYKNQNKF